MDIMTTLDSGHHSLAQPKQEPIDNSTDDNISFNGEQEEQCHDSAFVNGSTSDELPSCSTTTENGVIPPMKLHVTFSVTGKKQYRKRRPRSKEDEEVKLAKKRFSFVPKDKVTTRATTPSERLFCRKCNIQLFSYNLFELHTKGHALKSPLSVCVERLHLSPEVKKAIAIAKQREEEKEATNDDSNTKPETTEPVGLEVSAEARIDNETNLFAASCETTKDWEDNNNISTSEASSSFNQSLEKFQTDMIEELHQQIRRLSEASSTHEGKEESSMSTGENEPGAVNLNAIEKNAEVKDSVIVTNPHPVSQLTSNTQIVNQYERCCPSVAIIEKEPNVAPVQQRLPVPSVLSAILSGNIRPPPLQSMARMAFSQPLTHNSPVAKPFTTQQVDNSRPASVIYVDTVRPQLPSIESVVSLAPGYKQPAHYSNITFPTVPTSGGGVNETTHNNVVHNPSLHVTSGSACTCANCKDLLEGSLLRQAKVLLPGGFIEFHCPICKRRFQRKSSLWRHCRTANHGYICNMCGSGFLKQDMFEQHRQLHVARLASQSSTSSNVQGPSASSSNAQVPSAPSSTTTASNHSNRTSNTSVQEQPLRRQCQPHPQLTSRLIGNNSATAAIDTKDDDVIVVAVGKRTPPLTQNAATRSPANQASSTSVNARPQKDGLAAASSTTRSNAPTSQNINRILKSNEITLTPIGARQPALVESSARTVRMAPPNQPLVRGVLRVQGPLPRFEANRSYPPPQQQRLGPQQPIMLANNIAANIRMAMMARPTGPSATVSQAAQMNTSLASTMAQASGPRGQPAVNGNRNPQFHPTQMMTSVRMPQSGAVRMPQSGTVRMPQSGTVRMPVWHHPVTTQGPATSVTGPQRPHFLRPPQLVPVSSGGRMPMTTQSMTMMRPSFVRPSMAPQQRRPIHAGHIMPSNKPSNEFVMRPAANFASNDPMQRFAAPPSYFRQPLPYTRPPGSQVQDMTIKCVHCTATFSNHGSLQEHFNQSHAALLTCRRCKAKFSSLITLKRHESICACIEKVRCLKCKQVMHQDELIAHITAVHYPKGNDANSSQPLPCSSTTSSSMPNLASNVQPSVNVSWTMNGHTGTREMEGMATRQILNTDVMRTPVITNVVSLSCTSPKQSSEDVVERPASNPRQPLAVPNSAEVVTPIVIEDDPVISVLPTATDSNDKHETPLVVEADGTMISVLPTVTDTRESSDKPETPLQVNKECISSEPSPFIEKDANIEATVNGPVEEELPDISKTYPVVKTPPLEDKSQEESVCGIPNAEEKAVTPPMVLTPSIVDADSSAEFVDDVADENESVAVFPSDTPSPSVMSASPEHVFTADFASEKKLLCPICDKQLKTSEAFLEHIQIHKTAEVYDCALCDRSFSSKRLLVLHLRSHMRSCSKPTGSPDAKRRKLNEPPSFDMPTVQAQGGGRLVVALLDMEKVASSVSVLRNMGVVGLMSIDDFSVYLSKKTATGTGVDEGLPMMHLPNSDSTQQT